MNVKSQSQKLFLSILVFSSFLYCACGQAAQLRNLYIIAPRALYEGILILEKVFKVPISFEEQAYEYAGDSIPLYSNSVARIPRYRTIVVQYDAAAGPQEAIQRLLDAYHKEPGTPIYSCLVAQSGAGFVIKPQRVSVNNVRDSDYESTLDKIIDYKPNEGDSLESVILNIRNAYTNTTRSKVYCYTPKFNGQIIKWDSVRTLGRKSVAQYLEAVVNEYNRLGEGLISWSLLREPDTKDEVMGCHIIAEISQGEHQLCVIGPRPLSSALAIIQKHFGSIIGYEDPPFECTCDIISDLNGLPQIPSGGSITFTYSPTNSAEQVLRSLLDSYAFQGNTGMFSMCSPAANVFTIFPVKGRNKQGITIPVYALSTMHALEEGEVSVDVACQRLQEISGRSISRFGGSANDNENLSRNVTVLQGYSSLDCILATILKDTTRNITWRLKYEFTGYILYIENIENILNPMNHLVEGYNSSW